VTWFDERLKGVKLMDWERAALPVTRNVRERSLGLLDGDAPGETPKANVRTVCTADGVGGAVGGAVGGGSVMGATLRRLPSTSLTPTGRASGEATAVSDSTSRPSRP